MKEYDKTISNMLEIQKSLVLAKHKRDEAEDVMNIFWRLRKRNPAIKKN